MIYTTKSYRRAVENLTKKKKRKNYACVSSEVKKLLSTYSFQEISEMNYFLRSVKHLKLYKIRLPNNTMSKGKRGGYRLILLLDFIKEDITLLFIYPKIGPNGKSDLEVGEEIKLLKHYLEELKEKEIKVYPIE